MLPILLSMCVFALAGAISPGPVNLIAASIGARAGFYRALPHVLGATLSYMAIVWLVGSSLQQFLQRFPQAAGALQYAGAAYLLYLACRIARAPVQQAVATAPAPVGGLLQGVLSQSLNPKAWLVAMSGVSLFVTAGPDAAALLLAFCSISGLLCFASVATWAALGKLIARWLAQAHYQRLFNRGMALLLVATVVQMLAG
ncbi:LysE family translocator [Rhodoferax sp.]|uniref:LysE family translocator n=1 Tax=Rhodoferax sp. TaxID=50421 RepID=UPI00374CE9A7